MPEIVGSFSQGKMNKDLDERLIPKGQYRDAMNIQVTTSDGSDVGAAQNILGNALINNNQLGRQLIGGSWESVGSISDEKTNSIYFFISSTSGRSAIIEYKDEILTPILVDINGDVLMFSQGDIITGINIIDNLLFWTDNKTEPKKINIDNFKKNLHIDLTVHSNFYVNNNSIGEVKEEHITVIKKKPTKAPHVEVVPSLRSGKISGITSDVDGGTNFYKQADINVLDLKVPGDFVDLWMDQEVGQNDAGLGIDDQTGATQSTTYITRTNWESGDILVLKESIENPNVTESLNVQNFTLPYTYQAKVRVINTNDPTEQSPGVWAQKFECEIIDIDLSIPAQGDPNDPLQLFEVMLLDESSGVFELKFPRFATRYKYEDGEYSAFSPFSEVAFAANVFSYHPTKDPYNLAMVNMAKSIKIQDFIPSDIPDGVVQVDILYKQEDSPVIYSIASLKADDDAIGDTLNPWNSEGSSSINFDNNLIPTHKGSYEITVDRIHAALPSNQLLRPWDNVPKIALSQEITGNRLIYGNYLQGFNVNNKPRITAGYRARKIEGSGQIETGLIGTKSIKSLRDYQLGIIYGDEHGRETPIFTDKEAAFSVPMKEARDANQIWVNLSTEQPDMDYYKVFVKQTSGEYYNLIMDRVYRAEKEENLWISFPSSDRNKIKKEDFIILKKQIDLEKSVTVENKFKIIDIQNSAPEFIRAKYVEIGFMNETQLSSSVTAFPKTDSKLISIGQQDWIDNNPSLFSKSSQFEQGTFNIGVESTTRTNVEPLSIVFYRNDTNTGTGAVSNPTLSGDSTQEFASDRYEVLTYEDTGDNIEFTLKEDGISEKDLRWISPNGVSGSFNEGVSMKLFKEDRKNRPEFEGRFFVKILSNEVTQKFIEGQIELYGREKVVGSVNLYYLADEYGTYKLDASGSAIADYQNTHNSLLDANGNNDFDKWKSHERANWNRNLKDSNGNVIDKWFIDQTYFHAYQPTGTSDPKQNKIPNSHFTRGIHSPGKNYTKNHTGNFLGWDDDKNFYKEGKTYMNLSFSPVGEDLHDGQDNYIGGKNAQFDFQSIKPMSNSFSHTFDRNKFDNQWKPKGNKSIISALTPGSKFSFRKSFNFGPAAARGFMDEEIYEIKAVKEVHLYNYSKWHDVQSPLDGFYGWGYGRGLDQDDDAEATGLAMEKFGSARNRRTTYILEIENITGGEDNPNDDTTGNQYKPVDISNQTPHANRISTVGMEFTANVVEELEQDISTNPAVWETEPEEAVDLDIYYEASQAIPINYNEDAKRSNLHAPVGCKLWCSYDKYDSKPNYEESILYGWVSGNEIQLHPGFTAVELDGSPATTSDPSVQTQVYQNKTIRFFRDDFSFTSAKIDEVTAVYGAPGEKVIKKIKLKNNNMGSAVGLSFSNCFSFGNGVESNRIRDDFNKMQITNGVKVSKTLEEQYNEERRGNGLIYSGLYNSTSGVNNLNQFIQAEKITKDISPRFGTIQKLHARDTNLVALCEDKCLKILVNKDALFNADGNSQLTSTNNYLGQTIPFVGEYGISKNPESFTSESYRAYFTDKQRGAVLRLSQDGLTAVSEAGMRTYFKDKLKEPAYNIIGTYDDYKKDYNLTIDGGTGSLEDSITLTFSEDVRGWTSFKSFIPESGVSMGGDYYTFKEGKLWKHHDKDISRNTFYNISSNSTLTTIFNDLPSVMKSFTNLGYQGDSEWECSEIKTEKQKGSIKQWIDENGNTQPAFIEKEGKYFNYIKGEELGLDDEIDIKAFNFQGIGVPVIIEQL